MGKILDVQRNLYGLGLSPLSISNRDSALDDEFMSNKKIGMFGINTPSKNIVSAEYLDRSKRHLNDFISNCILENITGDVYKIIPDNQIVQLLANTNTNILNTPITYDFGSNNPKGFKCNFDIDVFDNATMAQLDNTKIQTSIQWIDGNSKAYNILGANLYEFNEKAYALKLGKSNNKYIMTIESIGFSLPASINTTTMTIVLYDILIAFAM